MVNPKLSKMHISKKNEVYLTLSDLSPSENQEMSEYYFRQKYDSDSRLFFDLLRSGNYDAIYNSTGFFS